MEFESGDGKRWDRESGLEKDSKLIDLLERINKITSKE
jgi:hypothetical protein